MYGHSRREDGVTRTGGWIIRMGAAALAASPLAVRAETDPMLATVDKSAVVWIRIAPAAAFGDTSRRRRVIISVTNYQPTADCRPVDVVVKGLTGDGPEVEIGRFGITPDRAFDAAEPSEALRFALPLPADLVTEQWVRLSVRLVPVEGGQPNSACPIGPGGENRAGASLRLGGLIIVP
jgi:hypothetical protein